MGPAIAPSNIFTEKLTKYIEDLFSIDDGKETTNLGRGDYVVQHG